LTSEPITFWLSASEEKRSERMSKRDNISISEALDIVKMRDRENKNIYKNIYGLQFGENKDVFDFIINTELLTLESLVYLCKEIIKKMKVQ
ncbi:MAG: cytidylate kinase family protein, partial [Nitrososphaeraceae archaeon]